ncbi:ABC transporter permease [Streptomyces uncialis]|uniref:ABC transporter permease n=1 Tax=Streptomyces uncialis TaxID=1048205 RepID=UPI00224D2DE2|nr:ABC transporter permease [Streptomyces uncialis]MCX4658753.1 ABC transporter permease [Streptomyces uncialis]
MTTTPTTTAPAAPPGHASSRRASPRTAVLRAEARLFLREPGTLFWVIGFPPLLLAILGSIPSFREADDDLGGLRLIDIYVPVAVLTGLIMAGLQAMPPVLTGYRESGILRRMSTTPVPPSALLSAQMGLIGAAALLSALVSLALGRLAFDVALPRQAAGYLLALVLAVTAAVAMGALLSALTRTAKAATAIGSTAVFPMLFCAGVWLPVQAMPDGIARVVECTPFGAAAVAFGQAAAGDWPAWSHLGVLALWTVVLSAAATRWFRWE